MRRQPASLSRALSEVRVAPQALAASPDWRCGPSRRGCLAKTARNLIGSGAPQTSGSTKEMSNETVGSTQASCGLMEASGSSGGVVAIDGVYG